MPNTPRAPRVRVHYTHEARRPHSCPTCGAELCNATNVEQDDPSGPVPGAFTLCIDCGHASVFTPDLLLRKLRAEELRAACAGQVFVTAYASMAATRRAYRRAHGEAEQ
jgi:hypothetical protein